MQGNMCRFLSTKANCGQARALWNYYDDSASLVFIEKQQMRNVMLLSVLSCVGRLLSGIGSDVIVKKLHASRFWCLFVSSGIFCIGQLCGTQIGNPHLLGFVSAITGCKIFHVGKPNFSLQKDSSVWFPLWRISIACRPNIRHQWSISKLGIHDPFPDFVRQYLQPSLRSHLR